MQNNLKDRNDDRGFEQADSHRSLAGGKPRQLRFEHVSEDTTRAQAK